MDEIRKFRKIAKMTQAELAEKAGLSRATIVNFENGKRIPHMNDIEKIATAVGCNVRDFYANPPQSSALESQQATEPRENSATA